MCIGHACLEARRSDVQACPNCGGHLRLIATIVDPRTIRALLLSLGVGGEGADRAPTRSPTARRRDGRARRPRPDPFTSDPSPAIRSCGPDATAPPVSAPAPPGRPADLDLRPAASPDAPDDPLDGRFDRGVSSRGWSNGQLGIAVQAHLPCAAGRQASENGLYVYLRSAHGSRGRDSVRPGRALISYGGGPPQI